MNKGIFYIIMMNTEYGYKVAKIGQTTQGMEARLRQHARYYKRHGYSYEVENILVIDDLTPLEAHAFEDLVRGQLMLKGKALYVPNDRFMYNENEEDDFIALMNDTVIETYDYIKALRH